MATAIRITRRSMVKYEGRDYYSRQLDEFHGREVTVMVPEQKAPQQLTVMVGDQVVFAVYVVAVTGDFYPVSVVEEAIARRKERRAFVQEMRQPQEAGVAVQRLRCPCVRANLVDPCLLPQGL